MIIRRINYSDNKRITCLCAEQSNPYIWVAFAQNSDGICLLEKQFVSQPDQTFFSLEREVLQIVKMVENTTKLFTAYQDDELIGEIITKASPFASTTELNIPDDIFEYPVDVQVNGSDLWFLFPGTTSGQNAKLALFTTGGDFDQIIDLNKTGVTVTDASTFAIDEEGDIWIVTNTSPATVVRVFQLTGGFYDFTVTEIV